ncbi:SNF2-related protein, partial [Gemmatimonadota bacterium]
MPRPRKPVDQLDIDFSSRQLDWPSSARFPYNDSPHTVRDVVVKDIRESSAPLIVTGYTSLGWIVELLANLSSRQGRQGPKLESLRLLIGNEPLPQYQAGRPLTKRPISQEIADYWLEQGISLRSCGKVLQALDFCENRRVEIRSSGSRTVHAKIYATENAVTIGSSNYSRSGMELQVEGNVRFEPVEKTRFRDATRYAENVWDSGDDYKSHFVELLRQLLQHVSWQEALGRACGELLEGDWVRTRLKVFDHGRLASMWPSQEQGVAQAMWILESMGSVLVADATGSGKTRMGARLLRALLHRVIRSGRDHGELPVLLTPPAVEEIWLEESIKNGVAVHMFSHGLLSRPDTKKGKRVGEAVRRAQILAVDEAHNFLSSTSVRTSRLHRNVAEHVLLFTATPLNRGPQDLLAIIDILGADNFDPKVLEIVDRVWRQHGARLDELSRGELLVLKNAIQRFTVRRTKAALNRLIDAAPERYTDRFGRPCRYPKHNARTYSCDESERDCALARQIRAECNGLLGLTALQSPFFVSASQRRDGVTDEAYLSWRLAGAKGLARHNVMACLRSSKMALH